MAPIVWWQLAIFGRRVNHFPVTADILSKREGRFISLLERYNCHVSTG